MKTWICKIGIGLMAVLFLFNGKAAHAEYFGGKFPHIPGQAIILKWYYSGGTRYLGNVWQGGENWRNGSARIRPERMYADNSETKIKIRDV